jgi:hypothetical protein
MTLNQKPFAFIDPDQLQVATTFQDKLHVLAITATSPAQLEKWLHCADTLFSGRAVSDSPNRAWLTDGLRLTPTRLITEMRPGLMVL